MKVELELFRPRITPFAEVTEQGLQECRMIMNTNVGQMIHTGLLANQFEPLADGMMAAMRGVTTVLVKLQLEPELEDFVHASAEMADFARREFDKALRFNNMDDVKACAVMLEVIIKGIASCLDLPYETLVRAAAAGETDLREILVSSGHLSGDSA